MIITGIRANHNLYDSILSIFNYSPSSKYLRGTKVDLGGTKEELVTASFILTVIKWIICICFPLRVPCSHSILELGQLWGHNHLCGLPLIEDFTGGTWLDWDCQCDAAKEPSLDLNLVLPLDVSALGEVTLCSATISKSIIWPKVVEVCECGLIIWQPLSAREESMGREEIQASLRKTDTA